jgi:hypothetical protein
MEQFLEQELIQECHLLALGIDEIGIARIPSTDNDWQRKLAWLVERCQCILYVPGPTIGALTEFELLCDDQLSKTIFMAAPSPGPSEGRPWRRSAFSFEVAWNTAISELAGRRPDLMEMLGKLKYRATGVLYQVHPDTREVKAYDFTVRNLVELVSSILAGSLDSD